MRINDGRGQWSRWNKQPTTDDYDQLDMQTFAAAVDLTQPCWGGWQWTRTNYLGERKSSISYAVTPGVGVRLCYKSDNQDFDYLVGVVATTPHYGGLRYWWRCPHCSQRVRILYGGQHFLCRKCHGLTYTTSQASKGDYQSRTRNRLWAIRQQLNAPGSVDDPLPAKPKGMHHQTYWRLYFEYSQLKELLMIGWLVNALQLTGPVGNLDEEIIDLCAASMPDAWQELKQKRKAPASQAEAAWWRGGDQTSLGPEAWSQLKRKANRLTLGELASLANVPYDFAQAAQREQLLRADQGRSQRRKRYRERLKGWLQKLHTLHTAGMTWAEIRAWAQRRFQPGHEQERIWPAGVVSSQAAV